MPVELNVTMNGGAEAKAFFVRLDSANKKMGPLFRSLGQLYVKDTQDRIKSQDGGRWVKASKWVRAKTGQSKPLLGAERYVKYVATDTSLKLTGNAPGWTLTMHQEGFVNKLRGPGDEEGEKGRVVIRLKDGRPLGKPNATSFAFVPKRPGVTPPRKIWPSIEDAVRIGQPVASAFYNKMVRDAGRGVVK